MRWLWLCVLLVACGPGPGDGAGSTRPTGPLLLYSSVAPFADLAAAIGGEHVQARCLAVAERDPRTGVPARDALRDLQKAELVFLVGDGWESWADLVALRPSVVVELADAVGDRLIHMDSDVTHQHGPKGPHSHREIAGEMWLDPALAVTLAGAIRDAMIARRPGRAEAFRAGHDAVVAELKAADAALAKLTPPALVTLGPAYRYLVRRYGWKADEHPVGAKGPFDTGWVLSGVAADAIGKARVVVVPTMAIPGEARLPARLKALAEQLAEK